MYKIFDWEFGDEDKFDKIFDKFEVYVCLRKNKWIVRFKSKIEEIRWKWVIW